MGPLEESLMSEAIKVAEAVIPGFTVLHCEPLKLGKSAVFAIQSVRGESPLALKCSQADTIVVEHRIMSWLMASPLECIRTHGMVPATAPGRAWLVSDLVGGEPFHSGNREHREVAGRWLGDLHAWSRSVDRPDLPLRDADYHREVVRNAGATLIDALQTGHALTREERRVIGRLADACSLLLDRWESVPAVLDALPQALVHSGVAAKNIRIARAEAFPAVLAFDWEQGGWGCPVADVSMVDFGVYRAQLESHGIGAGWSDLIAPVGTALWSLAGVPGERVNLTGRWPHRAAGKLVHYLSHVEAALQSIDGVGRS